MLQKCWLVWLAATAFTKNTTTTRAAPWFGRIYDKNEVDLEKYSSQVSPIINRALEASVVAHAWPSTPQSVICEAYAYLQSTHSKDGVHQQLTANEEAAAELSNHQFLSALSQQVLTMNSSTISTYASAQDLALATMAAAKSASGQHHQQELLLLEYALSMRAHSPHCELHRGLARQTLQHLQELATFREKDSDIFAVVYPGGHVVWEDEILRFATQGEGHNDIAFDWSSLPRDVATSSDSDLSSLLSPGEIPFGAHRSFHKDSHLVVLYANLGSLAFARAYQQLHQAMSTPSLQFVVRHLGAVHYEELGALSIIQPTVLQGYGVRLDIRNAEYKVFDDRKIDSAASEADSSSVNLESLFEESSFEAPRDFIAGVNASAFLEHVNNFNEHNATMNRILKELWERHEAQHARLIPPTWQRRKLSLQATSAIASSNDPLMTLEEISGNLPSVASTLVHLRIPDEILEVAEKIHDEFVTVSRTSGVLLVNGRQVNFDRPTFNVFELISILRKEQGEMERLQTELSPYFSPYPGVFKKIKDAWTMGSAFFDAYNDGPGEGYEDGVKSEVSPFRVDVGRGWKQAIIYLNDIERDPKYAQWPRAVQQALMAMQYGMAPSVRRNLFTLLAVINPLDSTQNVGFMLAKQLMQSNYPARLGLLLVDDEDVQACADWVSAHPSSETGEACPILNGSVLNEAYYDVKDKEKLKDYNGTARAFHRLFADLSTKHPTDLLDAYIEYTMNLIDEQKEMGSGGSLSMFDIIQIHVNTMRGLQMGSETKLWSDALSLLADSEEDNDDVMQPTYFKSVRFAVDKGLQTGMSFINGRPLPVGDPEEAFEKAGKVLNEELNDVFSKIKKGEINDATPKSVYALFLSGEGVFKKVHPLLLDTKDKDDYYINIAHEFDFQSLLFPTATSKQQADAIFVIDAVLDVGSAQGIQLATSFVAVMDSFPTFLPGSGEKAVGVKIGYRMIPSKASSFAKALCPILVNAGNIGATGLTSVLERAAALGSTEISTGDLLEGLEQVSDILKEKMRSDVSEGVCSRLISFNDTPGDNLIVSNGLSYAFEGSSITKDDVELLLLLGLEQSRAVTSYLKEDIAIGDAKGFESVARCISFLAREAALAQVARIGLEKDFLRLEKKLGIDENPLRFSWNEGAGDDAKFKVSAFIDPTSEMSQRLSPLLLVLRDSLKLPLTICLIPRITLDTDARVPITSFYRFVADPLALQDVTPPKAAFSNLPLGHTLTVRMDVPESWDIQQSHVIQDTDNLICNSQYGCGDEDYNGLENESIPAQDKDHVSRIEYGLSSLLIFGQCYETKGSPPNGLQLTLTKRSNLQLGSHTPNNEIEVGLDGTVSTYTNEFVPNGNEQGYFTGTLVMKTVGYWQLRANPGVWNIQIEKNSKGADIFAVVDGTIRNGKIEITGNLTDDSVKQVAIKDFVNRGELLLVQRREGFEKAKLLSLGSRQKSHEEEVIHVFSLATGHLYERFLKIMMLSVTRRTSTNVKFWLFENFLSPSFKDSARYMAERIGCEVEFVTYKWPEWLRGQSEKQRIIWGYKILFLDVLFPLDLKKIIYVDADQVIRGDLKELWDMDLQGAPYGYTPMCSSRESTVGFQFWNSGFWESHLRGKPYHISALYVVDLDKFRQDLVGDKLRSIYQQLSADPHSLANLDQDLPNYAQHAVPIFSLPQDWLWCESWCSDETKATAKTIDLCNNPLHKEPKVSMAKRVIDGPLFEESWVELDEIVETYRQDWLDAKN